MTPDKELLERVTRLVEPILREQSLDLVDIEFKPSGRRWSLRLFIDKEGGVTIGDCERVSRELGRILDVEDFIEKSYLLEVSSPGLDRPLKKKEDFERYRGREARVITTIPINGKNDLRGKIAAITDEKVEIEGETDRYEVPLHAIKRANLEFTL
jgi:ribosome maturation factor RimP